MNSWLVAGVKLLKYRDWGFGGWFQGLVLVGLIGTHSPHRETWPTE
jgi:hypothetical protein